MTNCSQNYAVNILRLNNTYTDALFQSLHKSFTIITEIKIKYLIYQPTLCL